LSIEFGIAKTYALGVGFYVVCACMLVVSRQTNRTVAAAAVPVAPSIQPTQAELAVNSPGRADSPAALARAGE
jgi:hypothetical protein